MDTLMAWWKMVDIRFRVALVFRCHQRLAILPCLPSGGERLTAVLVHFTVLASVYDRPRFKRLTLEYPVKYSRIVASAQRGNLSAKTCIRKKCCCRVPSFLIIVHSQSLFLRLLKCFTCFAQTPALNACLGEQRRLGMCASVSSRVMDHLWLFTTASVSSSCILHITLGGIVACSL